MKRLGVLLGLLAAGCRIEPTPPDEGPATGLPGDSSIRSEVPRIPDGTVIVTRPAVVAPSGLAIPVAGVQPADLVDTFDDARSEGRVHDAIDIMAPRGTPVVAAAGGVVARLFTSERGGLTVYVLGLDDRTVYYYAHLDAYAPDLSAADVVRRGDLLGTVGSTGNALPDGPHLHFAIWQTDRPESFWEGTSLNPYPLLTGR